MADAVQQTRRKVAALRDELGEASDPIDLEGVISSAANADIVLHDDVEALLREAGSGFIVRGTDMSIASEDDIDSFLAIISEEDFQLPKLFQMLPVINMWDGEYICVCHTGPIDGSVVHWSHEDTTSYIGADLAEVVEAFHQAVKAGAGYESAIWENWADTVFAKPASPLAVCEKLLPIMNSFDPKRYPGAFDGKSIASIILDIHPIERTSIIESLLAHENASITRLAQGWLDRNNLA